MLVALKNVHAREYKEMVIIIVSTKIILILGILVKSACVVFI
jgi:hypothetical protein